MLKIGIPIQPLKTREGYGLYEFFDLDQFIEQWARKHFDAGIVLQPKYDGIRLQVHKLGDVVKIFTEDKKRDRAAILPQIVAAARRIPHDFIFDTETLLYDPKTKQPLQRWDMAKIVVSKTPIKEPLKCFVHDILFLDKRPLIDLPYVERLRLLRGLRGFAPPFEIARSEIVKNPEQLRKAAQIFIEMPESEGFMAKVATSKYLLKGRTPEWAKFKLPKEIHVKVIGWSKVLPPGAARMPLEKAWKLSRTYVMRCAVIGPDGRTWVPIETKRKLGPSDLKLRWVEAGQIDPLTRKRVVRSEWRGRDDPKMWKMLAGWPHRGRGEFAYGVTYAIASDLAPKLGSIITVAPMRLELWKDDEGGAHLSWMHPVVRNLEYAKGADRWPDVERLLRASRVPVFDVKIQQGKLIVAQAFDVKAATAKTLQEELAEAFEEDIEDLQKPTKQDLHKIARLREDLALGDPWLVVYDGKPSRFVAQHHIMGLWHPLMLPGLLELLKKLKHARGRARREIERALRVEYQARLLTIPLPRLQAIAQKASDERKDVGAAIRPYLSVKFADYS